MDSETPPDEQARLRRAYLEAIDTYETASIAMRQAMDDASAALEILRRHVESGRPAREIDRLVTPEPLRAQLSAAAIDLERGRHAAQQFLFALLVEEGMTMADVGRMFGVSRSLVSRLVNELNESTTHSHSE